MYSIFQVCLPFLQMFTDSMWQIKDIKAFLNVIASIMSPCSHILKITNQIDETMIIGHHWKVFQVHYRIPDLELGKQLMKAISMQIIHANMGLPVSNACLEIALHPDISR